VDPAGGCNKQYDYEYRCCEGFADAGVDTISLLLVALIVYVGVGVGFRVVVQGKKMVTPSLSPHLPDMLCSAPYTTMRAGPSTLISWTCSAPFTTAIHKTTR
jgi:hypothetical protein